MTFAVRIASQVDADVLADLRVEMDAEDGIAEPLGFRTAFARWFVTEAHGWTALIADAGERAIGTLWLTFVSRVPRPTEPIAAPIGHLTNFFVRPDHRNRGVGSALLDRARAMAEDAGAELVLVWPSDRSMPLYERHGFAQPMDLLELRLR